jgi:ABC-2 type transport system ATP-binding protein
MTTAAFRFCDVVKVYPHGLRSRRSVQALAGVTLEAPMGEVLGLLGPNRAGKTTFVKLLLSLCRPTSGRIERLGRPAQDRRTLALVGYVHENHAFPRYLSARAVLEYYGALSVVSASALRERIPTLLELVGLADRGTEPIWRFSKGMIQRLGIAQALINEPQLLVLDEPSEGLDLHGRQLIREVIERQRAAGRSVLFVSHLLSDIEQLCSRIAILVNGRIAFTGPISSLLADSASEAKPSLEAAVRKFYT